MRLTFLLLVLGSQTAAAATVLVFYVFARYRFPLVPPLILFAAAGAGLAPAWWNANRARRRTTVGVALAGVAGVMRRRTTPAVPPVRGGGTTVTFGPPGRARYGSGVMRLLGVLALAAPVALGVLLVIEPAAVHSWVDEGYRSIVATVVAAVCGVSLTALVVAAYMRFRFARLVKAAERVAAGDYTTTVPVRGRGLDGRLATAVNDIAGALAETTDRATVDRLTGVANRQSLLGALFALQQHDMKTLAAYSTVSQLGLLVAVIGVGTRTALVAATIHTLTHALFKAALFMVVGLVDHQNGTRDLRRLGGLRHHMPLTTTIATLAALSMAGIPPFLGFISKENLFEAFLQAPGPSCRIPE